MIADIALAQFRLRRSAAQARRDNAIWAREEAECRLRPWAAAALVCGADPAAIHSDLAITLEDYRRAGTGDAVARQLTAMDLCDPETMLAAVAHARDASVGARLEGCADLAILACHLGCRPFVPADLQIEAKAAA
ncbi:hypothetical protein [Aurantiacibacter luteus]|uniref:Uncharacterized protein n=1 Tax=Aurantiacibacter luteus TaxID=1581420 RepID=A0A0G9MNY9_9SPHN|nr:hypothetical protein [Aurantiacibacter luteus]KLE32436.1 hypothetical protein AAW00_13455 [Aurantiacibacter luteus]